MAAYDLTVSAEADVVEIWQYTARTWSEAQAQAYHAELQGCFSRLALGPFRRFDDIAPGLRSCRVGRHVVFWLAAAGKVPQVIAVLHERMNLFARLADRLRDTR
ncbi:MAG: type II toxin-antitoxin system RelE/ParE family toxin [Vannielia sp.]|uniref:type II toxin-antitoxin system RelE/ParE family toxin n=1 Tax=Rhodobacterales TaxID=204455 RepID=UPI0020960732|nr:type II toxin-antitoxin system RelE/ParE family toxin [Oceanicola sp. 502str15]MCO6384605.1 type II toxin-antitoxin system RelE/ParE family toxin [Oceanicola sp. 502str15]